MSLTRSDLEWLPNGFKINLLQVEFLFDDPRHGLWFHLGGAREQIEIRITRGGRLRIGPIKKRVNHP